MSLPQLLHYLFFDPSSSEGLNGGLVSIQSTCVSVAGGAAGTVFTLAGIGTNSFLGIDQLNYL